MRRAEVLATAGFIAQTLRELNSSLNQRLGGHDLSDVATNQVAAALVRAD